jgi:ParB family transcriptional regulator, chromosome partitioning protein
MTKSRQIPMQGLETFRTQIAGRMEPPAVNESEAVEIPIGLLKAASWNARRHFDPTDLQGLGLDMLENGQIHAIMVRPMGKGFEVVVGERRLRAARIVQMPSLRANIRKLTDREARRIGLSENLQRENLNDFEETIGWLDLLALEFESLPEFEAFCQKDEESRLGVARVLYRFANESKGLSKINHNVMVKKTRLVSGTEFEKIIIAAFQNWVGMTWKSFVSNRLPILNLPKDLQDVMYRGELDYTKARELARITDYKARAELLERVLQLNMALTQIKELVATTIQKPTSEVDQFQVKFNKRLKSLTRKTVTLTENKQHRLEQLLAEIEDILS